MYIFQYTTKEKMASQKHAPKFQIAMGNYIHMCKHSSFETMMCEFIFPEGLPKCEGKVTG